MPVVDNSEVIAKSVTANDAQDKVFGLGLGGALNHFFNFWVAPNPLFSKKLPELPPYWSFKRDAVLSQTIEHEAFWAGAITIAITKMASQAWEVESDVQARMNRAHELFHTVDAGQGWVTFLEKHLQDYLCSDNGAFIEVVRATHAASSKVIGLMHLDSLSCERTGDPDYPVIYTDRLGVRHIMRSYQVIALSDMTNPRSTYFGIGRCAAGRAYSKIRRLAAIDSYVFSKLTGDRPHGMDFITGITKEQLEVIVSQSKRDTAENQSERGTSYGTRVLVPLMVRDNINHVGIEIAGLPDNFNAQQELAECLLAFANAIGLDVQDLQPLTGQALGTGAQSQVLDDKARGKGLAGWRQKITHRLNWLVLDDKTNFFFVENDYRDKKQKADLETVYTGNAKSMVEGQILDAVKAANYLVDNNVLDRKYLPAEDLTPTQSLDDTEKPGTEQGAEVPAQTLPAVQPGQEQPAVATPTDVKTIAQVIAKTETAKESKGDLLPAMDIPALLDEEIATARSIFEKIVNRDKEKDKEDSHAKEYAGSYSDITTKEAAEAAIAGGMRLPAYVLRAWPGLDMRRRKELREESKVA